MASFDLTITGGVATKGQLVQGVNDAIESSFNRSAPFGRTGLRIIQGELDDDHYGFGGIVAFDSGKWVLVYRQAPAHGTTDNAELRAADSTDKGATWTNDRLLRQEADCDLRPAFPRNMANGRAGFFVNRASEGTNKFPLFAYTDDEGVTFTFTQVNTSSVTYTFADQTGLLPFPASQGGHDTLGFFASGYIDAGGVDLFTTVDNGANWSTVSNVGVASGIIDTIGETWIQPIGGDRYLIFSRASLSGSTVDFLVVWKTADITDWGTPADAGVPSGGGNPPGLLFDSATDKIHMLQVARGTRSVDDFEHHLMTIEVDADDLWNADGDFSSLSLSYRPLFPIPHWGTGYIRPFLYDSSWYASFTAGEPGTAGGDTAVLCLVGDFTPTGGEAMQYVEYLTRSLRDVRLLDVRATDDVVTTFPVFVSDRSRANRLDINAHGIRRVVSSGGDFTFEFDDPIVLDVPTITHIAATNGATDRPLRVRNAADSAEIQIGAYSLNASLSTYTIAIQGTDRYVLSATGITVPNGNAANPSVRFSGSTDAGMYQPGSNQVGFATSGALRFSIVGNALRASGDGAAGSPVYTWADDPDTGIYRRATNQMSATAGGTESMRWTADRVEALVPSTAPDFTVGTTPAGQQGDKIFVTDEVGGAAPAWHDGTNFRRYSDGAVIST